MVQQSSAPPPARAAQLIHGAVVMGLIAIGIVLWAILRRQPAPVLAAVPYAAVAMAVLAGAVLMLALAILRPRLPARTTDQTEDAYWGSAAARNSAVRLWAALEGAGVIGFVGYYLTGAAGPGVVGVFAVAALFSVRPSRLQE